MPNDFTLDWDEDGLIDELMRPGGLAYRDLQRRMIKVVRHGKRVVRVDTGRLRSSLTSSEPERVGDALEASAGTDVEYGPYVEVRYPYLRPALQAAK